MKPSKRYAVIGDPIAHSLSPVMQRAALVQAGIDADYERVLVPPHELGAWVQQSRDLPYDGFNITIPHKQTVAALLDQLDPSAHRVGAVNTVVNRNGTLTGYNTDLPGFLATVRSLGVTLRGRHAVLLGAGGSARAVLRALDTEGATITISNRHPARAAALATALEVRAQIVAPESPEAARAVSGADLVINTTPVGMRHLPGSPLAPTAALAPHAAVIDLVYGAETPLLRQAKAAGCAAVDGIEMLVRQGAESFRLWTGIQPDLDVMRRACRAALQEVHA